jgi:DNA-binding beta-propeller fold protein YncE
MRMSSIEIIPPSTAAPFAAAWGQPGTKVGSFDEPREVACGADGSIYVADTKNCRIQKFTDTGKFIKAWGTKGTMDGQFQGPCGVTTDKSGNILVLDWVDNRVQRFTPDGVFINKFQGGFYGPYTIRCDETGNIWVSNAGGPNVQKFTVSGEFLRAYGTNGRKKGQFADPLSVAFDPEGNIYVVDNGNQRIQKYDANWNCIKQWSPPKSIPHNLRRIAASPLGNFYVIDETSKVWVINKNLKPLRMLTDPPQTKFGALAGMCFDKKGFLYVVNYRDARITKIGPLTE